MVCLFCLLVRDHSHNGTQDVIMHEFPVLVAIHFSVFVCFVLVVVVFLFAWFLLFLVVFFWFLAGTRWTAYRSTTSTFVAIDK